MISIEQVALGKMPLRLYHGTSAANCQRILEEGIKPRGRRKANDKDFSSRHDCVYLTDAYAIKFALDACGPVKNARLAIIEIDTALLDPGSFAPDDDVLAQQFGREKKLDPAKAIRQAQKMLPKYKSVVNAEASLRASGSCSYFGLISPICLTRVAFIDYEPQRWFVIGASDVGTGAVAYKFTKDRHKTKLAWVFDNMRPDVPPGIGPENTQVWQQVMGVPDDRTGIHVQPLRA